MDFKTPTVGSYFNPFSRADFHTNKFTKLSFSKKLAIVALTTFATILTLPIAGLGGLATYRALNQKFSTIHFNKVNTAFNNYTESSTLERTAAKTDDQGSSLTST